MDDKEVKLVAALETYVTLKQTEAAWEAERKRQYEEIKSKFGAGFERAMAKVEQIRTYGNLQKNRSEEASMRVDELMERVALKQQRLESCLARRTAALERILALVEARS